MENQKNPTHAQFSGLRDTAIAMGIDRGVITSLIDDGGFTDLMRNRRDQVIADRGNTFELKATVRQDRPYIEALEAGGPNTPSGHDVRKVGNLYPPVSNQEEEVEFILRNFPQGGGSWDKALAWAKSNGYEKTNPREVFAVAEQHDLLKFLNRNWLSLVVTTEHSFEGSRQAVCVFVKRSFRTAELSDFGPFDYGLGWFLFRK